MPLHPQTASRDTGDRRLEARQLGVDSPTLREGRPRAATKDANLTRRGFLDGTVLLPLRALRPALEEESVLNFVMQTKL